MRSTKAAKPPNKLAFGRRDDPLERRADRMANQVMHVPDSPSTQTEPRPRIGRPWSASSAAQAPGIVLDVLRSPGQALDPASRAFFEPRFGFDFSQIRVHADEKAARSAHLIGAAAYTAGQSIVFGRDSFRPDDGTGRRLIAHELTHVVQQAGNDAAGGIQRYEAGEHAQFGETGQYLKELINARSQAYVVKRGDSIASIAAAFGVTRSALIQRNKGQIKKFPAAGGESVPGTAAKTVPGFLIGARIEIPPVLNEAMQDALTTDELSYQAGKPDAAGRRATVNYGEGIAMGGDLFESPEQIDATDKSKIENMQSLIKGEKKSAKTGTFVGTDEWQKATDDRFVDLATKNEAHFAPSDPALVKAGPAGAANHKSTWEKYHKNALYSSQGGNKDQALEINSFADHFLTDAFSAGHLFNKLDAAEKFKSGIATTVPDPKKPTEREIAASSQGFFTSVAKLAFVGPVKTLFSQYQSVKSVAWIHEKFDTPEHFSDLLQALYLAKPDLVAGGVVKTLHDEFNHLAGGVPVENEKGDHWQLPGDKTLNASTTSPKDAAKTLEVGRKAVAQSQYNVLSVFKLTGPLDLQKFFRAVWDYVPRPTSAGAAGIKATIDVGTDSTKSTLISNLAALIRQEYRSILDKILRETPPKIERIPP